MQISFIRSHQGDLLLVFSISLTKTLLTGLQRSNIQFQLPQNVSEVVAAITCVEQVIDLPLTLRYLGVPIISESYVFGDNK